MAELSITELSQDIRAAIAELKNSPDIETVGVVTRVGDGIAWIYGLSGSGYNEMLEIEGVGGRHAVFDLRSAGRGAHSRARLHFH